MKRFIALMIVTALNFTVCTGGLFSATLVLASGFAQGQQQVAFMSSAESELFLCRTSTAIVQSSTEVIQEVEVTQKSISTGCSSEDSCLTSAQSIKPDRSTHCEKNVEHTKVYLPSITLPQMNYLVEPNAPNLPSLFNRTMIKIE